MKRIYLKPGNIIGCSGYTDLKVTKSGGLELHSTEGGELDFYDEPRDTHHKIKYDMDGNPKTNKNFGKMFYEKD
jgi:hypothetical protein